ncbi:MAG: hypothetical protein M0Z61_10180 [Nitrospiraceae bacterium]|nr:hypothetical protein [Nitrospiraceae bacterium]
MSEQEENTETGLARLSALAMGILLDEAEDDEMFEEALKLNSGNPEILKLLYNHPATPAGVRTEAAKALGLPTEKVFLKAQETAPETARMEEVQKEKEKEYLAQQIRGLTVGDKIRISIKAGREARTILLKDANKQVVLGVMANPRITVSEVEMAARNRSLPEEALREIAKNKEWVKNYTVIYNLVSNAKTPPGVSTGFLPWIKSKDLQLLLKNKDIPDAVRTAARRYNELRGKKK